MDISEMDELGVFADVESSARSYCRSFPVVFDQAQGSHLSVSYTHLTLPTKA